MGRLTVFFSGKSFNQKTVGVEGIFVQLDVYMSFHMFDIMSRGVSFFSGKWLHISYCLKILFQIFCFGGTRVQKGWMI